MRSRGEALGEVTVIIVVTLTIYDARQANAVVK